MGGALGQLQVAQHTLDAPDSSGFWVLLSKNRFPRGPLCHSVRILNGWGLGKEMPQSPADVQTGCPSWKLPLQPRSSSVMSQDTAGSRAWLQEKLLCWDAADPCTELPPLCPGGLGLLQVPPCPCAGQSPQLPSLPSGPQQ